nr:SymE family type I addiction module toxin [Providencia thailandensis]
MSTEPNTRHWVILNRRFACLTGIRRTWRIAANRGKPNPSPQLTLSGKWLKEIGFEVGSLFTLTRQPGQLIIRQAEGDWRAKVAK